MQCSALAEEQLIEMEMLVLFYWVCAFLSGMEVAELAMAHPVKA